MELFVQFQIVKHVLLNMNVKYVKTVSNKLMEFVTLNNKNVQQKTVNHALKETKTNVKPVTLITNQSTDNVKP